MAARSTIERTVADADPLEALIGGVARGDQRALARLYSATSAKLFGIAMRILRRRDWAEDVLQEAFVRVWHRAGDYRAAKGAPMAWLTTIVRNRAIDRLRADRGDIALDEVTERANWTDDGGSPEDLAVASADARELARCLEQLRPAQRDCIVLAYRDGYTHEELARRVERPLGTVKSWIRRGLAELKDCLER